MDTSTPDISSGTDTPLGAKPNKPENGSPEKQQSKEAGKPDYTTQPVNSPQTSAL